MRTKESEAARHRELRRKRREQGICKVCGKPAFPGSAECAICLQRRQPRDRVYRETHRGIRAEQSREMRRKRMEEGKCPRCGAPLRDDEVKYCAACQPRLPVIKGACA